jgi:ribosomal subunit interface protein
MDVQISIRNADVADALRAYVERRLHFSLGRFIGRLGRVRVQVTDVNGPRGGVDKSCRISAELLPGRRLVLHEAVDANLYVAIDHATEGIGRSFSRKLARDRELRATRESVRTSQVR